MKKIKEASQVKESRGSSLRGGGRGRAAIVKFCDEASGNGDVSLTRGKGACKLKEGGGSAIRECPYP